MQRRDPPEPRSGPLTEQSSGPLTEQSSSPLTEQGSTACLLLALPLELLLMVLAWLPAPDLLRARRACRGLAAAALRLLPRPLHRAAAAAGAGDFHALAALDALAAALGAVAPPLLARALRAHNGAGHTPLVRALLSAHAAPVTPVVDALLAAAAGCSPAALAAALEAADARGQTPLLAAAQECRWEAAALLLRRGANPRAADANGETALHHAVEAAATALSYGTGPGARHALGFVRLLLSADPLLSEVANLKDKTPMQIVKATRKQADLARKSCAADLREFEHELNLVIVGSLRAALAREAARQ